MKVYRSIIWAIKYHGGWCVFNVLHCVIWALDRVDSRFYRRLSALYVRYCLWYAALFAEGKTPHLGHSDTTKYSESRSHQNGTESEGR